MTALIGETRPAARRTGDPFRFISQIRPLNAAPLPAPVVDDREVAYLDQSIVRWAARTTYRQHAEPGDDSRRSGKCAQCVGSVSSGRCALLAWAMAYLGYPVGRNDAIWGVVGGTAP